jgi:hypothetical protein
MYSAQDNYTTDNTVSDDAHERGGVRRATHLSVEHNPQRNGKHIGDNCIYMGGFNSANQRLMMEADLP